MEYYHHPYTFTLESGAVLPSLTIAYCTYGTLNSSQSNVVWVCHHLSANADVANWWPGIVGTGKVIQPEKHFIVCANIIGSCYGSSGPLTINAATQQPYFSQFPTITIKDMVQAHILLRQHLGIKSIYLLTGGSLGGHQALEWCLYEPTVIKNMLLLATAAAETAWGIAAHTAQRLAIQADATWQSNSPSAGSNGLKAARAIGMLTYRNYSIMLQNQTDDDVEKIDDYKASSYINYQGNKLVNRFNAFSYWLLTKAMDSHNIARGRSASIAAVLQTITQPTLIFGINSDILCPLQEQQFLAEYIPQSTLITIDSNYGHDGFMVESAIIENHTQQWLQQL